MPRKPLKVPAPWSAYLAVAVGLMTVVATSPAGGAEPTRLSEEDYKGHANTVGIVIVQVNWGRQWKCGAFENAQLESLSFNGASQWELTTPSRLTAGNSFTPYALLVPPGKYVLTGYDVKVAMSSSEVIHLRGDETQLVRNGEPLGGVFTIAAGEVVYIGHIGLDCAREPTPWRYYIESHDEFDRYVAGFRKHFPFLASTPVMYRLMTTKLFGQDYSIESAPVPQAR